MKFWAENIGEKSFLWEGVCTKFLVPDWGDKVNSGYRAVVPDLQVSLADGPAGTTTPPESTKVVTELKVRQKGCTVQFPSGGIHNVGQHCTENQIYVFPEKELCSLSPNFLHSCVREQFIHSQDWSTYLAAAKYRPILEIYKSFTDIIECRNWETEHYNSVLEKTRLHSFISGKTKWELDVYTGFSRALHLHCGPLLSSSLWIYSN